MNTFLTILVVGIGSSIGGILRYICFIFTTKLIFLYSSSPKYILPFAIICTTSVINITGSFFITFLTSLLYSTFNYNQMLKVFITTGILGGFTTFSTFSFDFIYLIKEKLVFYAILYVIVSVTFSLLGAFIGFKVGKVLY